MGRNVFFETNLIRNCFENVNIFFISHCLKFSIETDLSQHVCSRLKLCRSEFSLWGIIYCAKFLDSIQFKSIDRDSIVSKSECNWIGGNLNWKEIQSFNSLLKMLILQMHFFFHTLLSNLSRDSGSSRLEYLWRWQKL